MSDRKPTMTVKQVARCFNCSTSFVRNLVAKGQLKASAYKPLRIEKAEVELALREWRVKVKLTEAQIKRRLDRVVEHQSARYWRALALIGEFATKKECEPLTANGRIPTVAEMERLALWVTDRVHNW